MTRASTMIRAAVAAMLAALLLVSAAPGGTVPSVSATEIYKAAQYCCAGCSYRSSCCCAPRNKKPATVTRFTATKTRTVISTGTKSLAKLSTRQLLWSDDAEVGGESSPEVQYDGSRRLNARHICPVCPTGHKVVSAGKSNWGSESGYSYCCPVRKTVTRTLPRTLTKTVTVKPTATLTGRAYYDIDKNGKWDPEIDEPIAFQLLHLIVPTTKKILGSARSNKLGLFKIFYNVENTPTISLVKQGDLTKVLITLSNGATSTEVRLIRPAKPTVNKPIKVTNNTATATGNGTPGLEVNLLCRILLAGGSGRANILACGSTTVSGSGTFAVDSTRLPSGTRNITAIQVNSQGAESEEELAGVARILAPPVISTASDNGNQSVDVSGTGVAGALLKLYEGSTLLGTVTVGASGTWSFTVINVSFGTHVLSATQQDAAGVSDLSKPKSVLVTIPPPVIVSAAANIGKTSTVSGTGEPGLLVKCYEGSTLLGSATVATDGTWTLTTSVLAVGTHILEATQEDASQVSAKSNQQSVVIAADLAPPVISSGLANNDKTVNVSGTGLAGLTIKVYEGTTVIGTTIVASDGTWKLTSSSALSTGNHIFVATQEDSTRVSGRSTSITVSVLDPLAPPVITSAAANGDKTVNMTGTGVAGSTLKVFEGSALVGSTTVAPDGTWKITTSSAFANGNHIFVATQQAATRISGLSNSVTVTISDLAAPVITSASPNNDKTINVTGTGLAGLTIKVYEGSTLVGTTLVALDGTWSLTSSSPFSSGKHTLFATQEDATKVSGASNSVMVGILDPPVITSATPNLDGTILVSGTGEAGLLVKIYEGSALLGNTTVGGGGTWSFTTSVLSAGTYSITASQEDATRISGLSAPVSATIVPVTTSASESRTMTPTVTTSHTITTTYTSSTSSRTTTSRTNTVRWPVIRFGTSGYNFGGYNDIWGFAVDSQGNSYTTGDGDGNAVISDNATLGVTGSFLMKLDNYAYFQWAVTLPNYALDAAVSPSDDIVYVTLKNIIGPVFGIGAYATSNGSQLWTLTPTPNCFIKYLTTDIDDGVIAAGWTNTASSWFSVGTVNVTVASSDKVPFVFKAFKNGTVAWLKVVGSGTGGFSAVYLDRTTRTIYAGGQFSGSSVVVDAINVTNPGPTTIIGGAVPETGCPFVMSLNALTGVVSGAGFLGCPDDSSAEFRGVVYSGGKIYASGLSKNNLTAQSLSFVECVGAGYPSAGKLCAIFAQFDATTFTALKIWPVTPDNYALTEGLAISETTGMIAMSVYRAGVAGTNFTAGDVSVECYNSGSGLSMWSIGVATFNPSTELFMSGTCVGSLLGSEAQIETVAIDAWDNVYLPFTMSRDIQIKSDPNATIWAAPFGTGAYYATIVKLDKDLFPSYSYL